MISSQYSKEFTDFDYGDIQKVYSVWICLNPPQKREHTITRYRLIEEHLIGEVEEPVENYDLLSVVILCLGDPNKANYASVLRMLDVLLSSEMGAAEKRQILQAELVLRIITGKQDLVITECKTQEDMKRLAGARSIFLDAYGTDSIGKKYDLEIQRADKGADPHRARYHSSVLDIENLNAGQEFHELPDTYTIFIVEKDFYGMGEPIYPIERINLLMGQPFGDGEHILYVNSKYRGDSDIGRLMHDFHCTNAADMHFPLMTERTRYLKENPKGVSEMCKVMEDVRREGRADGQIENIRNLAKNMQWTIEQAMDALSIAPAERETYRELLKE